MTGLVVVIIGVFIVLFVVAVVGGIIAARKRREAFAALAAAHGWTYVERDDRWNDVFTGDPFQNGHNRQSKNILSGTYDGRGFVTFDYTYHTTETSTDSEGRTTHREESHNFGIVALDVGAAFPPLSVTPEGMFGRLFGRLTNTDIELESEDFNRAFTVNCPDRRFASDILHPRMMEFLLLHRDAAFRFDRTWVLSSEPLHVDLDEVESRLGLLDTIVDNVPEFVWRDLGGER